MEPILTQPSAAPVINALRSIGYNANTAIADIIDNSIDAGASDIEVKMDYKKGDGIIRIIDNGSGMNIDEIQSAMNIGSKDPRTDRKNKELGRFGMGLKTASFSLGKRLSVISKKKNMTVERCWDLDYVSEREEWYLHPQVPDDIKPLADEIKGESGTIVIIDKLDRFMRAGSDQPIKEKSFYDKARKIQLHLSFVFHTLLEANSFSLKINGDLVRPWNPFLNHHDFLVKLSPQKIKQGRSIITVTSYLLPHSSHLNQVEYKEAGGPKGWRDQQGFYIYRENRLLYSGDWLGMFPKDAPSQLARIRVDITNEADELWQVDVKKSMVTPPEGVVKERLKAIAKEVRLQSKEVFYFRTKFSGEHTSVKGNMNPWLYSGHENGPEFILNYSHPILTDVLQKIDDDSAKMLNTYLKLVQLGSPSNAIQLTKVDPGKIQEVADSDKNMVFNFAQIYHQHASIVSSEDMADILLMQPTMEKFNRETMSYILKENKEKWIL